ncbi:Uncharacterised protein [Citrobacter koseri]|uniref:Uncharacterized protein n=1 Tax=Citrobacter koseri TaxID=545 RepID=A0A2X2XSE4_CITKO|nr:Uncharacterised protein [Citrobacter koseri]
MPHPGLNRSRSRRRWIITKPSPFFFGQLATCAIAGTFLTKTGAFIITLILERKVQTINQTKEAVITGRLLRR